MSIMIKDDALEAMLERLAEAHELKPKKAQLARGILKRAVKGDVDDVLEWLRGHGGAAPMQSQSK